MRQTILGVQPIAQPVKDLLQLRTRGFTTI
jgi:hypothetical protein